MLKIITITTTHRFFFFKRVNNISYFNLIVCCKTSEGGADLEGPIIFHLLHSM